MPETRDALDQRGVLGGAGSVVPDAAWRQAHDSALAALEMPGIVVVLGPAGVRGPFLQELTAGLREHGHAVTFVPRADLLEPQAAAGSTLVIEDAARMDAAMLETICRAPGRRVVLAGLPVFALPELPARLTVVTLAPLVTLEPLSPGTTAAPSSSSRINARAAFASGVLAATCLAGALLWTRATRAPSAPAPSRVSALQPAVELPPAPGFPLGPPGPAPAAADIASPPPALSASAPMPAGDEARPGIGTSRELPAVPVVSQTEPRSGSEPAPPQLQAGPSPVPDSREELNLPPAAEIATPPPAPPASVPMPAGDATSAVPPAPMPADDQARPGIGTSLEPAVPVVAKTEPQSGSEPAPPQLQVGPSPAPMPAGDQARPGIGTSLEPAVPVVAKTEPQSGSEPAPPQLQVGPSPAPMPAGDQALPGIGTSLEPAVPVVAKTEPQSGSEPAPPQLQVGPSPAPMPAGDQARLPSPGPDSLEALNLPPAAVIAPPPPEPAAPSGSAPQLLPENAPIRVLVSYAPRSAAARQEAAGIVRLLRGGGLAASDPAPDTRVRGNAGITYFFAEDRDGARRVEHDLDEGFGPARLSPAARGAPLPRPGTIEVLVPAK